MSNKIPTHIALIPDGNRRWAKKRGLQPWLGHKEGLSSFREVMEAAFTAGSKFATFWGASLDNLTKRTKVEVGFLVRYIRMELEKQSTLDYFVKEKIRARVIGEWPSVVTDKKFRRAVWNLENKTSAFKQRIATMLFGYDGQREMLAAIKALIQQGVKSATQESLAKALWTGYLPPVDLVIRTGGEPHWSAGFMMWLTANAQFYFTETLWPDFKKQELLAAYADFAQRGRRFGR